MKIDTKQKVLIAIYKEYQEDVPKMEENINASKLGINVEAFMVALDKLTNEELIRGVRFSRNGSKIFVAILDNMMITSKGIDYVETKLGIEKTLDGVEKIKYMASKCVELGWCEAKDILSSTFAKTIKG
ncbi:YjcQ family protein [Clostridium cadaveris]|uniref:YjcQ family protein n=1 Tax=Clostridium cadaveris TaxID=1529 RepID=UPI0004014F63|nr:YjcQ family protein [Clostridium cadaveris]